MTDEAKKPTAAERIAAANAKRANAKKVYDDAFAEQQADDLEALNDLEAEHGFGRTLRVDLNGWEPGQGAATLVLVKVPKSSEAIYKRYEQTVSKAKEGSTTLLDASRTLAEACILYPARGTALYDATIELAAGILLNLALQISKAVQGKAEEEKKD